MVVTYVEEDLVGEVPQTLGKGEAGSVSGGVDVRAVGAGEHRGNRFVRRRFVRGYFRTGNLWRLFAGQPAVRLPPPVYQRQVARHGCNDNLREKDGRGYSIF